MFPDDPGFNFEIHVISSSSDSITTELQVTAVRELNGVMVECAGLTTRFTSTISIASISEFRTIISYIDCLSIKKFEDTPAAPSGVVATNEQFTKTGASVNVSWSTSRGTDNYTVNVTPPIMPGQLSDFTTTDTSLLLNQMLLYNVNYSVSITAKNCAGSNSTVFSVRSLIYSQSL